MCIQQPLKSAGGQWSGAGISVGSAQFFPQLLTKLPCCTTSASSQESGTLGRGQPWCSGKEQGSRKCQLVLPISKVLPFRRCWTRSRTSLLVVLSGLDFLRVSLDRHPLKLNVSGTAVWQREQQIDWSNYKHLSAGFVGYLHPRVGSFEQPVFTAGKCRNHLLQRAVCTLETGPEVGTILHLPP